MPRSYLVVDLETVPDRDLWSPPEAPAGTERVFPPIYAHRIVVVGAMWLGEDCSLRRIGVFEKWRDEAEVLRDFAQFMTREQPDLVTFNGRCFDLPVIVHRSMRHGVPQPWFYGRRDFRYRFTFDGHFDLCDAMTEHGAIKGVSLDAAARLIGLPGKLGVDGSQVEGMFRANQIEALQGYCLSDVAQTAFLFLRFRMMMGGLDLDGYRAAARGLHEALAADPRIAKVFAAADLDRLLLR